MNITLKQIIPALSCIGVDRAHIDKAMDELRTLLEELDEVEVKGRQNVDTLLGCMMAIESIVGKEENNGE